MKRLPIIVFALIMASIACSSGGIQSGCVKCLPARPSGKIQFSVVSNRASFGPISLLQEGQRFYLTIHEMQPDEYFQMHKCGTPCNTASLIDLWDHTYENRLIIIDIPETGDYYFWIRDSSEDGPRSVVRIISGRLEGGNYIVSYESGSEITLGPVRPQQNAAGEVSTTFDEPSSTPNDLLGIFREFFFWLFNVETGD